MLIERGADVNLANRGGWTPLYLATDNRNIEAYCDAVEETVAMGYNAIKLGLIPLSGTQRLPRVVGLSAAIDFILNARTMQASEFASGTLLDMRADVSF